MFPDKKQAYEQKEGNGWMRVKSFIMCLVLLLLLVC